MQPLGMGRRARWARWARRSPPRSSSDPRSAPRRRAPASRLPPGSPRRSRSPNLALAARTLPRTRRTTQLAGSASRRGSPVLLIAAVKVRTGAALLVGSLLGTLAFTGMESTLALLADARFAMTPRDVGVLLAAAGVVMVLTQAVGVHRLARRWGPAAVATTGLVTVALSLAAMPLVPVAGLAAALCMLCAGYGLTGPALATLLSTITDDDERGAVLGANQSVMSLARVVGPLGAGAAFDAAPAAPYLLAAGIAAVAGTVVATWSARRRRQPPAERR